MKSMGIKVHIVPSFLSSYLIIPGHDHIYTDARAPNLLYLQHQYNDRLFKNKIHQETVHIGASMASPRDISWSKESWQK